MAFSFDTAAQIDTNRLLLRRFVPSDIPAMLKNWVADPDVQKEYGEPVYTTEQTVAELLHTWESQYRWAIILKEASENIGHVSFCRLYQDIATAEIEYCIGKAFWGRGITAEAVRAFIDHTFANTSITKIEAFHRRENPNSGRVLQKSGMSVADTVMRFSHLDKAPDNDICYAITK